MVSPWRVPMALLCGMAAAALVFFFDPSIDLAVAGLFYKGSNTFVGQTEVGEAIRRVFYWVPTLIVVMNAALYLARRFGHRVPWAPGGRGLLVLVISFALGPGLLVNTILKDHSHRPRPYQTIGFGGSEDFRPFYTFDGACARNCSFVSGEGSAGFWTLAPALLVPSPVRNVAVVASLVFALSTSLLRMAFGGHYLSDTIFAALFTWAVTWVTWRVILGRRERTRAP